MKRKFDKNDVLRFIYNEMEPEENEDFIVALSTDEELWELFEECQAARHNLEKVEMEEPSSTTVLKILDHAKVSRTRKNPFLFSKNNLLSFQFVASIAMVFITVGTILFSLMAYKSASTTDKSLVRDDLPQLQWEDHQYEKRMERTRMNLMNLSGDRNVVSPLHHNTYQVVNSREISNQSDDIVLINIK